MFTTSVLLLALAAPVPGDAPKGEKVPYTVQTGYFEKNTSELTGDSSYLFLRDAASFDKLFGTAFTSGKKPIVLPKDAFDTKAVVAVIKRGDAITTYEVEKVTADGETLTVQYKAVAGSKGTARFASPLILAVPKGKLSQVIFIENGKPVKTAK